MFSQLQLHRKKPSPPARKPKGFTLIELLVGIMISSVIIMPLLGLVDSLLRQDRQEQVKTRSEQELTAALDYIARDMQESVYIYDQNGVKTLWDNNRIPKIDNNVSAGTPVLVFWKRRFLGKDSEIDHDNKPGTDKVRVGDLEFLPDGKTPKDQDYYVFSLVVYYLIDNNTYNPSNIWAKNGMRIARWELSGGIETSTTNPNALSPRSGTPTDSRTYLAYPETGFLPLNLNAPVQNSSQVSTIAQKMNQWQPQTNSTWTSPIVLVDYIDKTPVSASANLTPKCPNPEDVVPASAANSTGNSSFYACVPEALKTNDNPRRPIAQVFIRGNALLRMEDNATYSESKKVYFPMSSVRVQGIGLIGGN